MFTKAVPGNDPVATRPFTVVDTKVALPPYAIPPTSPVTLPLHVMVKGSQLLWRTVRHR